MQRQFKGADLKQSNCPKLEDMAFKALLNRGLYNSFALSGDASKIYQNNVAAILERKIKDKVIPDFLQAVIDDDVPAITMLLDPYPWLLLVEAPKGLVIESKLTWQKFDVDGENALSLTAKLKKFCMLDKLKSYIKKLDSVDSAKALIALSQWAIYEICKVGEVDEIIIPQHIADYAQYLIDQFIAEPFPNVLVNGKPDLLHLSDKSEFAIKCLFELLCPNNVVKLDNLLDVELLLLAVYKAYANNFYNFYGFQNWEQRNAFCIRVIGLIQSVLTPETAKMFCEGIDDVNESIGLNRLIFNEPVSNLAEQLKLKGGESFYHSSRTSHLGLGFDFFCGLFGACCVEGLWAVECCRDVVLPWKNYLKKKQILFGKLCSNCNLSSTSTNIMPVISNRTG